MTAVPVEVLRVAAVPVKEQQPESLESLPENCTPVVAVADAALIVQPLSLVWAAQVAAVLVDGLVVIKLDKERNPPQPVLPTLAAAVVEGLMLPAMV